MKKISLVFLLAMVFSTICNSQESYITRDNRFTIEAGGDMIFGAASLKQFERNHPVTGGVYGEIRYTFKKVPVDVGFYAGYNILVRDVVKNGPDCDFKSTNFMITADYNWRLSRYVTAFAGAGLGMARIDHSKEVEVIPSEFPVVAFGDNGTSGSFAFMSRVGFTAFNVARVTMGYKFQEKANRHAFISLGFTLGLK